MTRRQEKINSFIRELASEFILREVAARGALITVTRASISANLKNLKIFMTIFPDKKEGQTLMEIKKHYRDWQECLAKNLKTKFLPRSEFLIDAGEKSAMKVEELLK